MKKIIEFIFIAVLWFIIVYVVITLAGCKVKRIEHTVYKTDTIKTSSIIKIREPQLTGLTIDSPCDSLGQLKPFIFTYGNDNDKKTVKSIDNKLVIIDDKKADTTKTVEKERISISEEKETIIKYKTPKWVWYSLLVNLLAGIWIFRKPLLKMVKPF
jgi:ABC-type uncharacterized transport system auxiliary subunit